MMNNKCIVRRPNQQLSTSSWERAHHLYCKQLHRHRPLVLNGHASGQGVTGVRKRGRCIAAQRPTLRHSWQGQAYPCLG